MAREKIVVVTLDADVTTLPTHPAFEKVDREGERGLAIHYNKDRMNAGEGLAAVNAMGHGNVDVSTPQADLEDVFLNLHTPANGKRHLSLDTRQMGMQPSGAQGRRGLLKPTT